MREILFRGKRTDNDEWIEGYLHKIDGVGKGYRAYGIQVQDIDSYMCRPHSHEVQPKTVGQFTGLTDKNGTKIFEGDVVRFNGQIGTIVFERGAFGIGIQNLIHYKRIEQFVEKRGAIYCGAYCDNFISLWEIYWNCDCSDLIIKDVEVIGNIHDNPELLEVE